MSAPDVVVVGGGPAGSAAAAWLAEAGIGVVLVERSDGPHDKVCGEFVGPGAAGYLARFGVPLGDEVRTLRLSCGARTVVAPLPFVAHTVSRREMDERLLEIAAARGADVRRGIAVRDLDRASLAVTLANGECLTPRAVFLATGKHELRGFRRAASDRDTHVGLKIRVRHDVADAAGAIDLRVFQGGYAGFLPLDATTATLCVAISARRYRQLGANWPALLAAVRAGAPNWARLVDAEPLWPQPLAVAGQPYGFVLPPEAGAIYRIGDQAAVVPSFSGEGMGIAFATARLAVDAYLKGEGAGVYARRVGTKFARVATLGTVSRLGEIGAIQALGARVAGFAPGLLTALARATRLVEAAR